MGDDQTIDQETTSTAPIRFRVNPNAPGGIAHEVPGLATYLRGLIYTATAEDWDILRAIRHGKTRVFTKA